ncbi:aminodeoxychorismate lyase domain protein [Mycobacterium xenopi 3993]|nr:aminodeoxychorismate lyase domain protein [Mycobacterium xenopi 3993]
MAHRVRPDNDYTGSGKRDIVIQVHDGDSTTAVGETLFNHGVVRTVRAFVDAAHGNSAISAIQPATTGCAPRSRPSQRCSASPTPTTGSASW